MPAYDFVVVSKPPFAYERAKTQPATASPRTALRASTIRSCSRLVIRGAANCTGRYSSGMPAVGSRHAVRVTAALLFIVLAAPAAAFGGGGSKCHASACRVYSEQGAPGGGGQQKPTTGPTTNTSQNGGGQQQPQTPTKLSRVLAHAGNDRGALSRLFAGDSALGNLHNNSNGGSPGLLGAAFDLGVGPTVLLGILLATGLGLAARGGARGLLRKRSSA
jgi:hypothetical protein